VFFVQVMAYISCLQSSLCTGRRHKANVGRWAGIKLQVKQMWNHRRVSMCALLNCG
jgi:hypothetical protein